MPCLTLPAVLSRNSSKTKKLFSRFRSCSSSSSPNFNSLVATECTVVVRLSSTELEQARVSFSQGSTREPSPEAELPRSDIKVARGTNKSSVQCLGDVEPAPTSLPGAMASPRQESSASVQDTQESQFLDKPTLPVCPVSSKSVQDTQESQFLEKPTLPSCPVVSSRRTMSANDETGPHDPQSQPSYESRSQPLESQLHEGSIPSRFPAQHDAELKAEEKAVVTDAKCTLHPKIQERECDFRDDWHLDEMFAQGGFSTVYHARRKEASASSTCSTTAVLKVSRSGSEEDLVKEAKFLQYIGVHPHIVECLDVYHSDKYGTALVLEPLNGGEVLRLIDAPCSEMHVKLVAIQVCQALGCIHSLGVVHRDVKAENIVFSGQGAEVKLVDFGLAAFEEDDEAMMKRCGSPGYIAPEIIRGKRSSFVADIFGLGVVVYLLIAGHLPFRGRTFQDILRRNVQCEVKFEDDMWFGLEEAQSFVESILVKDPKSRPGAETVWRHPWVASLLTE